MHIPIPIAALVQKAIDQTLPLDPDTQRALETIDGKVIAIAVQQPKVEFALSIVDREIQLMRIFDGEPDVTLAGPLSDFFAMQSSDSVINNGRIKITGDEKLANDFSLIVYRSEVDWQDALSPFLGETLVHKIGELGKRLGLWAGGTKDHLRDDTAEYLQEETQLLVPPNLVSGFAKKLESLVGQVDTVEQKLAAFEARVSHAADKENKPS